ncbi:MAG: bifunctional 2-polyprenyl-6-hydroxyphenol methylase/3-demethylubiquinol 3-O-methyltransferase UbiG [Alphaproteobacteria bacterium]
MTVQETVPPAAASAAAPAAASVDPEEIARFRAMAQHWWDDTGAHAPLHSMSAVRMSFIRRSILRHMGLPQAGLQTAGHRPFDGLEILDIGCGGGLAAEPLARLGAAVVAIDADDSAIAVARDHARAQDLTIDYRCMTAENMAASGRRFPIITCLELVEHVADLDAFMATAVSLLEPGGLLILSTINRTAKARLLAVTLAESVLRLVPRGTHDWRKFRTPGELSACLQAQGAQVEDLCGMTWSPLAGVWRLAPDTVSVNYLLTASRP